MFVVAPLFLKCEILVRLRELKQTYLIGVILAPAEAAERRTHTAQQKADTTTEELQSGSEEWRRNRQGRSQFSPQL